MYNVFHLLLMVCSYTRATVFPMAKRVTINVALCEKPGWSEEEKVSLRQFISILMRIVCSQRS